MFVLLDHSDDSDTPLLVLYKREKWKSFILRLLLGHVDTSVVVHFCQHNFPKCHHAYIRNNPCLECLRASTPRMNFIFSLYTKRLTLSTLSLILDPTTIVTDHCIA